MKYPTSEKLVESPAANTAMMIPMRVVVTPSTCQRLGHSFKIRLDMISATTGMQARTAPLSEAVVIRIPIVSQIK